LSGQAIASLKDYEKNFSIKKKNKIILKEE